MFLRPILRRAFATLLEESELGVLESLKTLELAGSSQVTGASTFSELGLSPLDLIEVIVLCEDKFKIQLDLEQITEIGTISDLVDVIVQRRRAS